MRWYVIRAEEYLQEVPRRTVSRHSVADVQKYLDEASRKNRLQDWHFKQVVDAIQKLLQVAGAPGSEKEQGGFGVKSPLDDLDIRELK